MRPPPNSKKLESNKGQERNRNCLLERLRSFFVQKSKEKDPCCYVKPKVEMKTKGNAAYKGRFGTLEEARESDKVICLIPSRDGRMVEPP